MVHSEDKQLCAWSYSLSVQREGLWSTFPENVQPGESFEFLNEFGERRLGSLCQLYGGRIRSLDAWSPHNVITVRFRANPHYFNTL